MKYLYYTLYLLDIKTSFLIRRAAPLDNNCSLMSALMSFFCISVFSMISKDIFSHYPLLIIVLFLVIYIPTEKILFRYFKTREKNIIKEISARPLKEKVIIVLLSLFFIITLILMSIWFMYY
jgi:hypothetical protein